MPPFARPLACTALLALAVPLLAACGDRDDEAWGLCTLVTDTRFDGSCALANREGDCEAARDSFGTAEGVEWRADYATRDECAEALQALRDTWQSARDNAE